MGSPKEAVVYKITNLVNSKVYIGQTIDWRRRLRHHKKNEMLPHLKRSYQTYGLENFLFEVIDTFDITLPDCPSQMNLREKELINRYQSDNPSFGYNKTSGGKLYFSHTPEACAKIGKANQGKITSQETRKLLSQAQNAIKKSVLCIELDKQFESVSEASRQTGIRKGNITSVLSGRQKRAGGYHWRKIA